MVEKLKMVPIRTNSRRNACLSLLVLAAAALSQGASYTSRFSCTVSQLTVRPHAPSRLPRWRSPTTTMDASRSGEEKPAPEAASLAKTLIQANGMATTVAYTAMSYCKFGGTAAALDNLRVAQTLTPLPLAWSCYLALASASQVGWGRLASATYRRLNLAVVTYSLLSAYAALKLAPGPLRKFSLAVWWASAATSLAVWWRSRPNEEGAFAVSDFAEKLCGDVLKIFSPPPPSSPGAADGRNSIACLAAIFAIATCRGTPLGRHGTPWTALAAAVCVVLRDAAERGRSDASTFVTYVLSWMELID